MLDDGLLFFPIYRESSFNSFEAVTSIQSSYLHVFETSTEKSSGFDAILFKQPRRISTIFGHTQHMKLEDMKYHHSRPMTAPKKMDT